MPAGLENSCDNGQVDRGQFVLFNGASFLADLKPDALKASRSSWRRLGQLALPRLTKLLLACLSLICEGFGMHRLCVSASVC